MSKLPEDLLHYLRATRLKHSQKALIRELSIEYSGKRLTVSEYVNRYVKRAMRIRETLESSRTRR